MTKEEKIREIIDKVLNIGKNIDSSGDIASIRFTGENIPQIYMSLPDWDFIEKRVVKRQHRILGISITNRSESGIECWADYYDSSSNQDEGYDVKALSDIEIDNINNIIDILGESDPDKLKDLLDNFRKTIDSNTILSNEYNVMQEGLDFILEQWRTNKRYFREDLGIVTTEDVIKKVYEYAWNKRGEFN